MVELAARRLGRWDSNPPISRFVSDRCEQRLSAELNGPFPPVCHWCVAQCGPAVAPRPSGPPVRLTEVAPQATEPPRGLAPGRQGFPMHPQFTQRPPAPGTAADVHLLIGNGRAPVVVAEITPVLDRDVLYLRLQVDDVPRFGTRHG